MQDSQRTRPPTALPGLVAVTLGVVLILAGLSSARADTVGQLQQQISSSQGQVSSLSGAVSATGARLGQLNASIATIQAHIASVQAELNAKLGRFSVVQSQLVTARTRLARLEAYEARASQTLSRQLVAGYESPPPNLMTVVLQATGFSQLLEQLDYEQKIRNQDVAVVTRVRSARRQVAAQAVRLGALAVRQHAIAAQVLQQRNLLAQARLNLVQQQEAVSRAHAQRVGQLAVWRGHLGALQARLSRIRAAQAEVAARAALRAAGLPSNGSVTPASAGGFTFPLPKSAVVPPADWSQDQGVDMAAPGNTPEYAVCSGTIVLHGIGGFGPWAPVLHCDSPVGGYSYVYYGHAGPLYQQPVGTHVSAGQVMSSIGPGIVGISTGPHVELGFADSSGNPIGSQSSGTMLSLLQASYAA